MRELGHSSDSVMLVEVGVVGGRGFGEDRDRESCE